MSYNDKLPNTIFSGDFTTGHVQGIAIDTKREFMYYSFTTMLVKTDLAGKLIGTVEGLVGHLGCIAFNDADGCVYGSLEFKGDAIGRGILAHLGQERELENAFYLVRFDVEKIDRVGMDAESDSIMTGIYCKEVVDDYEGTGVDGKPHRFGCSGIDGTTFAPAFGDPGGKRYLCVAYGIYSDVEREDNDYQVIVAYDPDEFTRYARPVNQEHMHHSGPEKSAKYFAFTGNTTYGIQNLEYDAESGDYFAAVYPGVKPQYDNPPFFVFDGAKAPERMELRGNPGVWGDVVTVKTALDFPHGDTGMISLGDGLWYFSDHGYADGKWNSTVRLYSKSGLKFSAEF